MQIFLVMGIPGLMGNGDWVTEKDRSGLMLYDKWVITR